VSLVDPLGTTTGDVVRESRLCNPVAIDGIAPPDPDAHLACFALREQGTMPLVGDVLVIENRFGRQAVRLGERSGDRTLCLPAHLGVAPSAAPLARLGRGPFRCRPVVALDPRRLTPAPELLLEDAFEAKRMHVRALRQLCAPVVISGTEAPPPSAWIACYAVSQLAGEPAFVPPRDVPAASDLASQTLVVRNAERRLCVPTEVVE
jgi:hypothetical protein